MRNGEAPRPFAVVEDRPQAAALGTEFAPLVEARIAYQQCPLCDGDDIPYEIEAKVADHPLYKPQLPPTVKWRGCTRCGHVFTEGHLTPEAREILFPWNEPHRQIGADADGQRKVAARIVERVARHAPNGEWLDIEVGDGALLFTAAEWGYQTFGTDHCIESVEMLLKLGFKAYWGNVEDLTETNRFSVVSMAGALGRMPFPKSTLAALHNMMRPGAALYLSLPNRDTIVWRILDASGANPYWGDLEHGHLFTRERLVKLLETHGFKFVEYGVADRDPSWMELIAIRT